MNLEDDRNDVSVRLERDTEQHSEAGDGQHVVDARSGDHQRRDSLLDAVALLLQR